MPVKFESNEAVLQTDFKYPSEMYIAQKSLIIYMYNNLEVTRRW